MTNSDVLPLTIFSSTNTLGRCELCKVKFHFAPQYAENAPDQLSMSEVFLGLARRAASRWLPFLVRLAFCMSLWMIIAPLMTSYLYLVWMNRSFSCVIDRWNWNLVPADTVSGSILAAIILISFLSLMSFADFLRVEWQHQHHQHPHQPHQRVDPLDPDGRRQLRRELADAAEANRRQQDEVDNDLFVRFNAEREKREKNEFRHENDIDNTQTCNAQEQNNAAEARDRVDDVANNDSADDNGRDDGHDGENPVDENEEVDDGGNGEVDNDNNDAEAGHIRDDEPVRAAGQQDPLPPPNPRPQRQFDADANNFDLLQDDQVVSHALAGVGFGIVPIKRFYCKISHFSYLSDCAGYGNKRCLGRAARSTRTNKLLGSKFIMVACV